MLEIAFDAYALIEFCNLLAKRDAAWEQVLDAYGYPPFWSRTASFGTLIHIILEQQVSLASAKAAFLQLQKNIGHVTPEKITNMTDAELKACYFSRQKIVYARALAEAVLTRKLIIEELHLLDNATIHKKLTAIKGIGNWTTAIFLMMVLHRSDCFPTGDIALIKSTREVFHLPANTTKEAILVKATEWQPYRTIAAFMLWHAYLCKRNTQYNALT